VREWLATLEACWTQAVDLVGVEVARVWRLYLAGGALAFEQGRMGVDQILARRPDRRVVDTESIVDTESNSA
jgi:cyclopropane-fatty-acyl-phospholipid synthase